MRYAHWPFVEVGPAMRTFRPSILFVIATLVVASLGVAPRGLALCIGGHSPGQTLTGWCHEHGGHAHGTSCEMTSATCKAKHHGLGCEHSHGHDHKNAPCVDIPLGIDDCRPQSPERLIDAGNSLHLVSVAVPSITCSLACVANDPRHAPWGRDHSRHGPPNQVCAALRATVIVI
jgi:hypothetical protein